MIRRFPTTARGILAVSALLAGLAVGGSYARPAAALANPVPVTIVTPTGILSATSSAPDVGALLEEANVRLGPNDIVTPSLASSIPTNGIVRVIHVRVWQREERRPIVAPTQHRLDFAIAPGSSIVVAPGRTGERDVTVRFTQRNNGRIVATVLTSHVIRRAKPRIVDEGTGRYDEFARIVGHGTEKTFEIASRAMHMVATAYTAGCSGCSGITAIGEPAGRGIVAVDPNVIPLGTKLYIPGYGFAIAGDTGGAIRGARIDLGFDSLGDAVNFGRRDIVVYRVK